VERSFLFNHKRRRELSVNKRRGPEQSQYPKTVELPYDRSSRSLHCLIGRQDNPNYYKCAVCQKTPATNEVSTLGFSDTAKNHLMIKRMIAKCSIHKKRKVGRVESRGRRRGAMDGDSSQGVGRIVKKRDPLFIISH
jgi:hypothetical protein